MENPNEKIPIEMYGEDNLPLAEEWMEVKTRDPKMTANEWLNTKTEKYNDYNGYKWTYNVDEDSIERLNEDKTWSKSSAASAAQAAPAPATSAAAAASAAAADNKRKPLSKLKTVAKTVVVAKNLETLLKDTNIKELLTKVKEIRQKAVKTNNNALEDQADRFISELEKQSNKEDNVNEQEIVQHIPNDYPLVNNELTDLFSGASAEELGGVLVKRNQIRPIAKNQKKSAKKKTKPKENEGATNSTTNLLKYLHILINGIYENSPTNKKNAAEI